MGIIISAILALIFIVFIVSHNDKYGILCLFIGMWAGICILATLKLYGMRDYNDYAFVVILIGCLAYVMGYMFSCKARIGIRNVTTIENNETGDLSQINTTILRLLVIVSLIYYVVLFLQMVRELSSGTTYYMFRRMYQGYEESSLYTSAIQQYIGSYISVPTIFVLEAIAVMWTFQKKYKQYKILYFSIIITIALYIITSASRIAILTIIVEAIFCLRIYKVSISKKAKRNIRRMIILLIVAIL
ncbi:MAG: oligosaccharide repeat unit polymerase, partial [Oscillospiraceae bacterium]|nr:oligosaccharide repeat unit polymerase [Oscillospiraceae bacterium]